ncbi:RNA-binding domain-containing protein [Verminephrobacter aporrectodeae]|uniref:RNA-binding domain-containing protein n=1 Tax=Verminephrobacter aporrectodeae TaxID=1110389 RepID=UPI00224319B8|nr:RNA-binding domain-containing protein [Verminephrobacter aporrectodeae]MCW8176903.1 transcriptional regulator [Verminephrobacter aporrectodeae subsp. tuberculatae]MCW8204381.1 transcriptional regulator [Verminephrobacter aporrectodeae subsp. tuberculatae]
MLKTELLEIIANGENSGVEFKRDDIRADALAREIVAMANLRGGMVLLGVEDDGTISGIQRRNLETWVMDAILGHVHPMLLPFYEVVALDGGQRVAVVSVTTGSSKPYVLRHNGREEIYIRVGSTVRFADRNQQARLFATGGLLHSETMPVSGATIHALDRERLQDYLLSCAGDRELPATEVAWIDRMLGLGFMTDVHAAAPVCTIAGLVLFGRTPRRFLRQAGIRWMAFSGIDKSYQALDDTILDAPLVGRFARQDGGARELLERGLIEDLMDRLQGQPLVSTEGENLGDGLRRERIWHYPPESLREAVVNALAHRDWTRTPEVEIVAYSNRLEVTSPGALQNSMTVEKMLAGQRSPRNTAIVDVLRDHGYVDARGMGVRRKIVPLVRAASGAEPDFEATEDYLKLILPRSDPGGPNSPLN